MKGEVVYLYAFDVANEINTSCVKEILADKTALFEIQTDHTVPKDAGLYKPLSVEPSPLEIFYKGSTIHPLVHIYEVGVISIAIRIAFDVKHLRDLLPYHQPVLENGRALSQVARALCGEMYESLKGAMIQGTEPPEPEAYTVFCLTNISTKKDIQGWLSEQRAAVAELLTESKPGLLSEMQVAEVLRIQHSFAKTDIAVIDWDAALVVDLTGYVEDTLYMLELANLQLEEYRVMDQRLDRYLDKAYEDIRQHRFRPFGAYSSILPTLRALRVDVTKLNDEVTHITKFFGDWYLARVYLGARERFHLNQWRASVEERLKQLDGLYTVVHTEVNNLRMLWLEALIVIFFAIDLIVIFLKQ